MMRHNVLIFMVLTAILSASQSSAQQISHSDVFFTYGESQIEIAPQDGRLAIPQVMPQGGFFAQANSNPGFYSERDVGGGIGPDDIVAYNILSDLVYWNNGEFSPPLADTVIRIINNPSSLDDTVIGEATGEQPASFDPLSNSIGQSSSSGDFHSHVDFRLEPLTDVPEETPLPGAYGFKLSLSSDNMAVAESDPFFIVFQFGIDEEQFGDALDAFDDLLGEIPGILGDFNNDGFLSAVDIDLLSREVLAGTHTAAFDLTNDQMVNELDRSTWVEELANTHFGDADLDGDVAFADFLSLSQHFGALGGWVEGDFDGDGTVAFPDFLQLSGNFGLSGSGPVASVPEPTGLGWLAALLVTATIVRQRNTR